MKHLPLIILAAFTLILIGYTSSVSYQAETYKEKVKDYESNYLMIPISDIKENYTDLFFAEGQAIQITANYRNKQSAPSCKPQIACIPGQQSFIK